MARWKARAKAHFHDWRKWWLESWRVKGWRDNPQIAPDRGSWLRLKHESIWRSSRKQEQIWARSRSRFKVVWDRCETHMYSKPIRGMSTERNTPLFRIRICLILFSRAVHRRESENTKWKKENSVCPVENLRCNMFSRQIWGVYLLSAYSNCSLAVCVFIFYLHV